MLWANGGVGRVLDRRPRPRASAFCPLLIPSPACVAVPPEHLPGRHAVLGSDPGQLVPHLQRESACDNSWHPACGSPMPACSAALASAAAAAYLPELLRSPPPPPCPPPISHRTHARTHAPPPSPPLILAPAARLTRHDSAPPGKLHPDCDPVPPDRPELRQSGQPGGCAPLSDRPEAVLAESSAYSREVGRLKGGGGPCHTKNKKRAAGPRLVYIMYVRNIPCVFVRN